MKIKYFDLIYQSFDWPQAEFQLSEGKLAFHGIPMMDLVEEFGTPLRLTYLPKFIIESDATIVAPLVFGWLLDW